MDGGISGAARGFTFAVFDRRLKPPLLQGFDNHNLTIMDFIENRIIG